MAPVGSDLHTRVSTLPDGRAVITRRVHAPVGVIWSVLADGWQHTDWVAGSSIDGAVEPRWPDPGSRVRHLSGRWRVVSNDHTEVIATEPGRELRLATHRRWSSGTNQVRIYVSPGGAPASSFVRIVEDTVTGPGTMLPRPVRQLLITRRNTDALHRLASLAEVRHRESILNAELGNVAKRRGSGHPPQRGASRSAGREVATSGHTRARPDLCPGFRCVLATPAHQRG